MGNPKKRFFKKLLKMKKKGVKLSPVAENLRVKLLGIVKQTEPAPLSSDDIRKKENEESEMGVEFEIKVGPEPSPKVDEELLKELLPEPKLPSKKKVRKRRQLRVKRMKDDGTAKTSDEIKEELKSLKEEDE